MMPYYGNSSILKGDLYGIDPTSLTDEQFRSIRFNKMLELVDIDPRAIHIVSDKMAYDSIKELDRIKNIREDIIKHKQLNDAYNKFVSLRSKDISEHIKNTYTYRADFIFWEALNNANKLTEIKDLVKEGTYYSGQNSVVPCEIDYVWLYEQDRQIYYDAVSRILKWNNKYSRYMLNNLNYDTLYREFPEIGARIIKHGFEYGGNVLYNIIKKMPSEVYQAVLPQIFTKENKKHIKYALTRKDTPQKYVMLALRDIAGKHSLPQVEVEITTAMLEKLPPITRMKAIHSVMFGSVGTKNIFVDLTEEKLKNLLFTSTIRYTDRVSSIVNYFNGNMSKRQ